MRSAQDYWRQNVNLLLKCLVVWFVCSYLFGIILFEELNAISLGGYKLGFWFAQQGSIYIFLIIIYYYVRRMNALDREFDVDEK
jgi:putative solute:sodium symporter small subunit